MRVVMVQLIVPLAPSINQHETRIVVFALATTITCTTNKE
jgi:hypothetical protein